MSSSELSRRDFQKLTAAALGGLLSGAVVGCGDPPAVGPKKSAQANGAATDFKMLDLEVHLCRGLNQCKGQGAGGENDCAGMGDCATPSTHHECGGQNACKGQGGCGETAAKNECKGQGKCHVPLMSSAWKDARALFESEMTKASKKFAPAPAKKKSST